MQDIEKLKKLFEELLEDWYTSEETAINEYCSSDLDEQLENLEIRKEAYKQEFNDALNHNVESLK